MRLIDADALVKVQMYDEEHEEWSVETMTVEECLARFADVPTIIEMDRPQGEWIIEIDVNGNTYGRCSICGMRQYAGQLNFCPDCGARMKGADDGNK